MQDRGHPSRRLFGRLGGRGGSLPVARGIDIGPTDEDHAVMGDALEEITRSGARNREERRIVMMH